MTRPAAAHEPVRLTWLGHSTVLVEQDGVRLVTDPLLRRRVAFLQRAEAVDIDTVGDVDAVLISHMHYDHFDVPSLRLFSRSTRVFVPRGAGRQVRKLGFGDVVELERDEERRLGDLVVRSTHAEHDAQRWPSWRRTASLGYVLTGTATVYFAGDTDLFEEMHDVAPALDVALLPVAGWGPKVPAGHLDPARAAAAVTRLRPRVAIPIHWGTYRRLDLRLDPADMRRPADEFARAVGEVAPDVRTYVLPVGGSVEVETMGSPARGDVQNTHAAHTSTGRLCDSS
jgi:L-ascorbate metabolism protein UlaG (beta-lactamase superfamily)